MKNNYIIGIDGGGTNTKCILFDFEGKTIDCIDSSGSNLYVYKESGVKVITQILSKILDKNKLSFSQISAFGIGIAGISDIFQRELLLKELDKLNISQKTLVMSDVESAYSLLCPANNGILINVGTGVICFAKENDQNYKIAGNGFDKGDIGSGYWLGKELLSKLILNEGVILFDKDLRPIFQKIKEVFKQDDMNAIYKTIEENNNVFSKLSLLGKEAIYLAESGNDIALSVVQEGTRYVSDYIVELCELVNYNNTSLILAANGSVIKNDFYRKLVNDSLSFEFESIKWIISDLSPAYGAGIMAANYNNIKIDMSKIVLNIN